MVDGDAKEKELIGNIFGIPLKYEDYFISPHPHHEAKIIPHLRRGLFISDLELFHTALEK